MAQQHAQPSAAERRHSRRRAVSLVARVRTPAPPWLACTVRNISAMGALLDFGSPVLLPGTLILQIPALMLEVECSVRHSDGQSVGVLFTSHRQATVALFD